MVYKRDDVAMMWRWGNDELLGLCDVFITFCFCFEQSNNAYRKSFAWYLNLFLPCIIRDISYVSSCCYFFTLKGSKDFTCLSCPCYFFTKSVFNPLNSDYENRSIHCGGVLQKSYLVYCLLPFKLQFGGKSEPIFWFLQFQELSLVHAKTGVPNKVKRRLPNFWVKSEIPFFGVPLYARGNKLEKGLIIRSKMMKKEKWLKRSMSFFPLLLPHTAFVSKREARGGEREGTQGSESKGALRSR